MSLTILSVAYPLAPVSLDAVGGAEQVMSQLDHALTQAGHRSIVVACAGSRAAGTLVEVPKVEGQLDTAWAEAHERHRRAVATALERWAVDVVHMHGIDYNAYLPPPGVPVLATLHGPLSWYWDTALHPSRPDTWLHCVSQTQHRACPATMPLLPPIENGVPVQALTARHGKRRFAVMLGRVCPEKGIHLAIEAAKRADIPLLIAGEVFAYATHQRYFAEKVEPLLDDQRRFIGPIGFARKRRLLTAAQCLLVPSTESETSSLVAREALACGTPVVAFPNGALPETIEHGRTGFLVSDVEEMAAAIERCRALDPALCRRVACERFSFERMADRYIGTYDMLAASRTGQTRLSGVA